MDMLFIYFVEGLHILWVCLSVTHFWWDPCLKLCEVSLEPLWLIAADSETEIAPALFWIPKLNCITFGPSLRLTLGGFEIWICGLELSWTLSSMVWFQCDYPWYRHLRHHHSEKNKTKQIILSFVCCWSEKIK